ncbi:MAG: diacylglycerol kinase family protein [Candidatus Melainabacteria bacterium]|nr:MAG: diacylglycerol kinase family protein [Candidatus Melainabacteria bacterium]
MKSLGVPKGKVAQHRSRTVDLMETGVSPESLESAYTEPSAAAQVSTIVPQAWHRKTGPAITMIESFYHAFHGIWIGLKEERNVRIHFSLVLVVTVLGLWLKVSTQDWISLIVAMSIVVSAEFVNTSLEHLVDISSNNEYHESARYAKDTAAAAVLIASVAAAAIGMIVFVPKLLALLAH